MDIVSEAAIVGTAWVYIRSSASILLAFFYYFLIFSYFLMGDRNGVDPGRKESGEELAGVEGEESVFRLYCMRKESYVL